MIILNYKVKLPRCDKARLLQEDVAKLDDYVYCLSFEFFDTAVEDSL